MGLKVLSEEPQPDPRPPTGGSTRSTISGCGRWSAATVDVDARARALPGAVPRRLGRTRLENDGFNRLVLAAGLTAARRSSSLRAYCKYMLQIGTPFSQAYIEQTLVANPALARDLAELFDAALRPGARATARPSAQAALEQRIWRGSNQVASLDEDRILRRYLEPDPGDLAHQRLPAATRRRAAQGLRVLQVRPARGCPACRCRGRPSRSSSTRPRVEGVHLRGGKVARGGLRWSDRREDFRTEVLGLMKAQMVKNSVIVPVGAKGGFVVKRPPAGGDRAALQEEAIRCYRTFLARPARHHRQPARRAASCRRTDVVRYDDDDPYLVVAADKGTATFSDIANARQPRATASGSTTPSPRAARPATTTRAWASPPRGAWESVKRHFRELGLDPQTRAVHGRSASATCRATCSATACCCRDQIKLVAAFDHRHIFLDPDPDPARSFAERQRLFALPRSSWADYDTSADQRRAAASARAPPSRSRSAPRSGAALGIEADEPDARPS